MDRVYESSFTRAILKALISLTASGSLPGTGVAVTKLAMDRLQDKIGHGASNPCWYVLTLFAYPICRLFEIESLIPTAMHVLYSHHIQLLTTLLENNPFMGRLNPEPYRQKLTDLYTFVKANMPTSIEEAHQEARKEALEADDNETA
jgi:condensin complex subunit 1